MLRYVMYTEESTTHFDEGDKLFISYISDSEKT